MQLLIITIVAAVILLLNSVTTHAATYTYDELNRLKTVTYGAGNVITYNYDAAGNITAVDKAGTGVSDTTPPTVTAFILPVSSGTLSFTVSSLTATDDSGVTGYCITGENAATNCTWTDGPPATVTLVDGSINGLYTLYAFAKDAENNISTGVPAEIILARPQLSVTIASSNAGGGSVTSTPGGISCASGTCLEIYDTATAVSLTATANALSTFANWAGCNSSSGSTCNVTMETDKAVTANFSLAPKARIVDTGYTSFSSAYAAASASGSTTIMLLEDSFTLGVSSVNKQLILEGGYRSDFSRTTSGSTALQGVLTIGSGSLVVDRVIVK